MTFSNLEEAVRAVGDYIHTRFLGELKGIPPNTPEYLDRFNQTGRALAQEGAYGLLEAYQGLGLIDHGKQTGSPEIVQFGQDWGSKRG